MGYPRQEYENGLPFPSPGDLANPGTEPRPLALQADSLPSKSPGKPKFKFTKAYSPKLGFPGGSEVKASACNAGDLGSIPGLGRSPGEGNGNPL